MSQAPVWLLDEPLNALDGPAQQAFRAALERHLHTGGVAVAATHADLGLAAARTFELGGRP
jgi:heme exporter protein A